MKKPKVAIYMSCYNHEKYVKEAMDSILRQTYKNWELYVVNDGSTDKTGSILESYHDERIHYYNFDKNTKFVGAANFLQKKIEGIKVDYIAVMASDDMWEGNKLEKQIDILIKHPEYRACFTWDKIIFDIDAGAYKNNMTYSHKENVNRYEWVKMLLNKGNCFNATSILMEKDIFYELGRMNENYIQLGDWRLWLKLAEKYPFYLVEEELTYYRRHGENLSEPSVEVFIRSFNEEERIIRELIHSMEKNTFRRIFYKNLSYTECNTDEELLAEKFIVMIENHKASFEQAAIDFYFEHCDNDLFTGTLENKYRFTSAEFINMTGNGGLSFVINNLRVKSSQS